MRTQTKSNTHITAVSKYSGPLPRPEDLIRYNDAVPGAAERIITMAEKEMEHRHETENRLIKNRIKLSFVSVILSFISVLVMSALVGYSLYIGKFGTAIGLAIGSIASVAGVFIYAKVNKSKKE
jgi:uncharacterized membrane protein